MWFRVGRRHGYRRRHHTLRQDRDAVARLIRHVDLSAALRRSETVGLRPTGTMAILSPVAALEATAVLVSRLLTHKTGAGGGSGEVCCAGTAGRCSSSLRKPPRHPASQSTRAPLGKWTTGHMNAPSEGKGSVLCSSVVCPTAREKFLDLVEVVGLLLCVPVASSTMPPAPREAVLVDRRRTAVAMAVSHINSVARNRYHAQAQLLGSTTVTASTPATNADGFHRSPHSWSRRTAKAVATVAVSEATIKTTKAARCTRPCQEVVHDNVSAGSCGRLTGKADSPIAAPTSMTADDATLPERLAGNVPRSAAPRASTTAPVPAKVSTMSHPCGPMARLLGQGTPWWFPTVHP